MSSDRARDALEACRGGLPEDTVEAIRSALDAFDRLSAAGMHRRASERLQAAVALAGEHRLSDELVSVTRRHCRQFKSRTELEGIADAVVVGN